MKRIFIPTILVVAAVSGFIGYRANINNSESLSDLALTNIEALTNEESSSNRPLDCRYKVVPQPCSLTVSAEAAAKLFGISVGNGEGAITMDVDGAHECQGGGDTTCVPVRCDELILAIFSRL